MAKINKITHKNKPERPDELHNADFLRIINKVLNYIRFKMPIKFLLAFGCCKKPPCLPKFAQFQLEQINEGKKYIKDSLDIQTLVRTRARVDILMKLLFNKQ